MHVTEGGVLLLDADPDLGSDLSPGEFAVARRHLRARVRVVEPGDWEPPSDDVSDGALGLLVVRGVLVRDVSVRGRCCAELVGAGDILRPWDHADTLEASVGHRFSWRVLQEAHLAEIDARMVAKIARWPAVTSAIVARSLRRVHTLGLQYALAQVQGVDVRLHLVLWHLADRWGRVTPDGVVLRLPMTHQLLGRLIGARRPSVTSSLKRLHRDGLVMRMDDGAWLLRGSPHDVELRHESTRRRPPLTAAA